MINTDKYEGHTEGPWVCTHSPVNGGGQFWSVVDHTQPTDVGDDTLGNWRIADIIDFEADAQLIADAPVLLAEVKRLNMIITMLKKNDLWVSQEGWEEYDKDDELLVSMDYLIQGFQELRGDLNE